LVEDAVVVSFQPDANSFFSNHVSLSLPLPISSGGKNLRQEASRLVLLLHNLRNGSGAYSVSAFANGEA
jgi:hypothetical protein